MLFEESYKKPKLKLIEMKLESPIKKEPIEQRIALLYPKIEANRL